MNKRLLLCLVPFVGLWLQAARGQDENQLTADSMTQPGVPQGQILGPFTWTSQIFPGTIRDYWLYVPAQYDGQQAACVMVVQDGLNRAEGWQLPTVMDNLIHQQQMPVTIGIFINPGIVPAASDSAQPRYNRSFEYDSLGDRYARFLLEEILPEVGRQYQLSEDPNDRLIAGASSGAICAFNVAWERPDAFRRVLSTIGTYVGLRDGHQLPVLVRKTEPKPIRVFLQDGRNDLDIYAGSWWVANQDMLAALEWAGYDVRHAWGDGGHDGRHAAAILPEALRWLWRDHPQPIEAGWTEQRRMDLLIRDEPWQEVGSGYQFAEGPAVHATGDVFFTDIPKSHIYRITSDAKVTLFAENTGRANGMMFGADGRLYACADSKQQIVAYTPDGLPHVVAEGIRCNDLVVSQHGIHFTDPMNRQVYFVGKDNKPKVVDAGIERPNGIALSPDQSLLYVADSRGQFVYSFQVQPDGSLAHKQPYFHLHVPYGETDAGTDGLAVDNEGRVYAATRMGLQVCDQPGRVHLILPKPHNGWLSNVVLGGPQRDTLYVTCGDKVFRRRVKATGVNYAVEPVKPPKPRL